MRAYLCRTASRRGILLQSVLVYLSCHFESIHEVPVKIGLLFMFLIPPHWTISE